MNLSRPQIRRFGRILLVLMFVMASVVPGSLHAAVMAGSEAAAGGGHHGMQHGPAAHETVSQIDSGLSDFSDHDTHPLEQDGASTLCCPATCSVAVCGFAHEKTFTRVPDSFELDLMQRFVVVTLALPERPPRA